MAIAEDSHDDVRDHDGKERHRKNARGQSPIRPANNQQ
jgi:hypothetical protein